MRTILLRYSDPKDPSPSPSSSPTTSPRTSPSTPSRFPTDTRGFFYLHAAQDTHGRLLPATQLRFRLLPTADPAHFASGTDLTQPCGARWAQPLDKLLRYPMYQPLMYKDVEIKIVVDTAGKIVWVTGGSVSFDERKQFSEFPHELQAPSHTSTRKMKRMRYTASGKAKY
ncbi:hypothetical protein FA15DRAFT_698383 [Coprinopsis marcescibilis]|uniref:Uncharacterized protein n=1 Tax=Coprinopsis marcescibilis TaxID=230819 RepID=A0A5C3KC38_COPMA|nr:hypothetical protein FA15DRAFT_698383 [Coprinopsis marcescibilis]